MTPQRMVTATTRGRAGTGVPRRITNRHARVRLPAAHEVTTADTVEVTACGENRLPAAGKHTPPGAIPAPRAHITGGEERA